MITWRFLGSFISYSILALVMYLYIHLINQLWGLCWEYIDLRSWLSTMYSEVTTVKKQEFVFYHSLEQAWSIRGLLHDWLVLRNNPQMWTRETVYASSSHRLTVDLAFTHAWKFQKKQGSRVWRKGILYKQDCSSLKRKLMTLKGLLC